MTPEIVAAMIRARDRAGRTPDLVRRAFLGTARPRGVVALHSLSIGSLRLLEEINHPACTEDDERSLMPVRDLVHAAFILAKPESARDALAVSRAEFERQALMFSARVSIQHFQGLSASVRESSCVVPARCPVEALAPRSRAPNSLGRRKTRGSGGR